MSFAPRLPFSHDLSAHSADATWRIIITVVKFHSRPACHTRAHHHGPCAACVRHMRARFEGARHCLKTLSEVMCALDVCRASAAATRWSAARGPPLRASLHHGRRHSARAAAGPAIATMTASSSASHPRPPNLAAATPTMLPCQLAAGGSWAPAAEWSRTGSLHIQRGPRARLQSSAAGTIGGLFFSTKLLPRSPGVPNRVGDSRSAAFPKGNK